MKMKRFLAIWLSFGLILSLAACENNGVVDEENSSGEKSKKDTLIVAQAADIMSTDPLNAVNAYSISVNRHLYDYLINLNEDGTFSPMLAESWELINPLLVELRLRQDVLFHNGEKMTAEDVVYSLERARDLPLTLTQGMFGEITAVDEYTVQVELLQEFGAIELLFCRTGTQIVNKKAMEADYDGFVQHPIGTGPFKFVSWSKGDNITMEAFDEYWGGPPASENLIIRVIAEPSQRLIALENGEVDIAYDIGANDVAKIEENSDLSIAMGASSRCVYLATNYSKTDSPVANREVLQAIQYAIDKEAIVSAVSYGYGSVAHTMIPDFAFGHTDSITTEYNVEKAKMLLDEAGYPDGFEVTLNAFSDQTYTETANIIQNQLAEIGIDVKLSITDQATLIENSGNPDHDFIMNFWMTVGDAHNTFHPYYLSTSANVSSGNSAFYKNSELDKYVMEEMVSSDQEIRINAFEEIHKIAAEDLPYIPIFFTPILVGTTADVDGFVVDPYGYHRLTNVAAYE